MKEYEDSVRKQREVREFEERYFKEVREFRERYFREPIKGKTYGEIYREFNLKEKLYVWTGGLIGGMTIPILTRYNLFGESKNLGEEILMWSTSIMQSGVLAAPLMVSGLYVGFAIAINSAIKRKRELEEMFGVQDNEFPIREQSFYLRNDKFPIREQTF